MRGVEARTSFPQLYFEQKRNAVGIFQGIQGSQGAKVAADAFFESRQMYLLVSLKITKHCGGASWSIAELLAKRGSPVIACKKEKFADQILMSERGRRSSWRTAG